MDPIQTAFNAVANGRAGAPAAAFIAGVATSFGPCMAPRFIAIGAIAGGDRTARSLVRVVAFICGLVASSVVLAAVVSFTAQLNRLSGVIYAVLAIALGLHGAQSLFADMSPKCTHKPVTSIGGSFLVGSSFAFVLSPCCAPFIAALATVGAANGAVAFTSIVLIAFSAGHASPLLVAGCGAARVKRFLESHFLSMPGSVVSGGLAIALAAYYALLV